MSTPAFRPETAVANKPGRLEGLEGSTLRLPSGEMILFRHCRGFSELDACVDLQQQTWGYLDREVAPRKIFLLAQELGGQVIGAFDASERLVAFAMAMAAFPRQGPHVGAGEPPAAYLHSHMLAVRPEHRGSGIGQRLKLLQREDALARGIDRMTWTFDPTAARNANLNLQKLGAISRRYAADFYGVSSSRLQGGLPSDRLHVEWWLGSPRVCSRVQSLRETGEYGRSSALLPSIESTVERTILLPAATEEWKASGDERARSLQQTNRVLFERAFSEGLVATGFHRDAVGNGVYELSRWSPA